MYLALFAANTGLPDTLDSELSGSGYARQPVNLATDGRNDALVTFPEATAAWGLVQYAALIDTLTDGSVQSNANAVKLYGPLSTPLYVNTGQRLSVPVGGLISLANAEAAPAAGEDGVAIDISHDGWVLVAGEWVYSLTHNLESTDLITRFRDESNAEISPNSLSFPSTNRIEIAVPAEPDCRFAGRALIERA